MNQLRLLPLCCAVSIWAADDGTLDLGRRLNAEAHGFVSFGYLQTTGNDWLGETTEGTTQFHEAAANIIARPYDRLRLGAQLFTRDLVAYDNGRVELDWAYADYRAADAFGIQVGRYKIPLGLYNESLDVDAARTPVFLDTSMYALRSRDLYISADGAKIYGLVPLGRAGDLDYALHLGAKSYSDDGGFATYLGEVGFGDPGTVSVESEFMAGAMVQWNTPVPDFALRLSAGELHGFHTEGTVGGVPITSDVDDYLQMIGSLLWDPGSVTVVAEYSRFHGRGSIHSSGVETPFADNGDGGYLAVTWHVRPWLDLYTAASASYSDATDRDESHSFRLIAAAQVTPLDHLSLKLELQQVDGTQGLTVANNPDGFDDSWQVIALKTTVDF